jgi:hypothetical protein
MQMAHGEEVGGGPDRGERKSPPERARQASPTPSQLFNYTCYVYTSLRPQKITKQLRIWLDMGRVVITWGGGAGVAAVECRPCPPPATPPPPPSRLVFLSPSRRRRGAALAYTEDRCRPCAAKPNCGTAQKAANGTVPLWSELYADRLWGPDRRLPGGLKPGTVLQPAGKRDNASGDRAGAGGRRGARARGAREPEGEGRREGRGARRVGGAGAWARVGAGAGPRVGGARGRGGGGDRGRGWGVIPNPRRSSEPPDGPRRRGATVRKYREKPKLQFTDVGRERHRLRGRPHFVRPAAEASARNATEGRSARRDPRSGGTGSAGAAPSGVAFSTKRIVGALLLVSRRGHGREERDVAGAGPGMLR